MCSRSAGHSVGRISTRYRASGRHALVALLLIIASLVIVGFGLGAGTTAQYLYDRAPSLVTVGSALPVEPGPASLGVGGTSEGADYGYDPVSSPARHELGPRRSRFFAPRVVPGVKTPYGVAAQSDDATSIALRSQTEAGATVYRQGTLGVQETGSGQFWAGENPLTSSGYASSYGTPGSAAPDWVMGGSVRSGAPFVTRPAPGIGANLGGAPEVVVNPDDVFDFWFHMP